MMPQQRNHWPEYLMEAGELATFMMSAATFGLLLGHPASPIRQAVADPIARRLITGIAMGCTAVAIVMSPWGRQSGAHMNPSLTLTFLRLRKIAPWDAAFYVFAQFVGGTVGILIASLLIGPALASPGVNYVATQPGPPGSLVAFIAELLISFVLMLTVLSVSNNRQLARFTPYFVGVLIASYITLEDPFSGMSMNPARSFGPAVVGSVWHGLWVYFTAPPLGMLLAAETYVRRRGPNAVWCAKLHHDNRRRCIFHCAHPV